MISHKAQAVEYAWKKKKKRKRGGKREKKEKEKKQLSMHVGSGPTSCLERMLWIKHSVGTLLAPPAVFSLKGHCGDE